MQNYLKRLESEEGNLNELGGACLRSSCAPTDSVWQHFQVAELVFK